MKSMKFFLRLSSIALFALSITSAVEALEIHSSIKFDNGGVCDPAPGGGYHC